jgi:hypothetical protein
MHTAGLNRFAVSTMSFAAVINLPRKIETTIPVYVLPLKESLVSDECGKRTRQGFGKRYASKSNFEILSYDACIVSLVLIQISAHPNQISAHPNQILDHKYQISAHPNEILAHPNQISAHQNQISAHQNHILYCFTHDVTNLCGGIMCRVHALRAKKLTDLCLCE